MSRAEIAVFRAARKRGQAGQASGAVLGVVFALALIVAVKGWALMLAWGIAASVLGVATIGFFPAVAVAVLLTLAFGSSVNS